jgi:hypothetical protein
MSLLNSILIMYLHCFRNYLHSPVTPHVVEADFYHFWDIENLIMNFRSFK